MNNTVFFSIKNWDELQHYRDRTPPWIKLYNHLLDDYEFASLQDDSKLHLVLIWLLASRNRNKLPYDNEWIKQRIGVSGDVDLDELALSGFIHIDKEKLEEIQSHKDNASKEISTCNQSADTEERESRGEREGEQSRHSSTSSPDIVLIFDYWKRVFPEEHGCRLTSGRSNKIKSRLKDGYTVEQIKTAIDGCSMSEYHMGKNDNGKTYNCLTLICRSAEKLEQFIGYTKKTSYIDKRDQEVDDWVNNRDQGVIIEGESRELF